MSVPTQATFIDPLDAILQEMSDIADAARLTASGDLTLVGPKTRLGNGRLLDGDIKHTSAGSAGTGKSCTDILFKPTALSYPELRAAFDYYNLKHGLEAARFYLSSQLLAKMAIPGLIEQNDSSFSLSQKSKDTFSPKFALDIVEIQHGEETHLNRDQYIAHEIFSTHYRSLLMGLFNPRNQEIIDLADALKAKVDKGIVPSVEEYLSYMKLCNFPAQNVSITKDGQLSFDIAEEAIDALKYKHKQLKEKGNTLTSSFSSLISYFELYNYSSDQDNKFRHYTASLPSNELSAERANLFDLTFTYANLVTYNYNDSTLINPCVIIAGTPEAVAQKVIEEEKAIFIHACDKSLQAIEQHVETHYGVKLNEPQSSAVQAIKPLKDAKVAAFEELYYTIQGQKETVQRIQEIPQTSVSRQMVDIAIASQKVEQAIMKAESNPAITKFHGFLSFLKNFFKQTFGLKTNREEFLNHNVKNTFTTFKIKEVKAITTQDEDISQDASPRGPSPIGR